VYQVTDRPELITSGFHVTLRPELPDPRERVDFCEGCERCKSPDVSATRFRLPWAAEESELRRRLGVEPRRDPDGFVRDLRDSLLDALPFLRRVRRIELARDGAEVAVFTCQREEDNIELSGPNGTRRLERLLGSFEEDAEELRARPGAPIEDKRVSTVEVLVGELDHGRIYAGLPTQKQLSARMLVHGDFFPHSSRKVISLEHDVRSDWNRAGLRAAAVAVANAVDTLPDRIGVVETWELLASMRRTANEETDEAFADWWTIAAGGAAQAKILPTHDGGRTTPAGALYVAAEDDDAALDVLAQLGFAVAAPSVRRIVASLPRSEDLQMSDLTPATLAGVLESTEMGDLAALDRRVLWELMDRMLGRLRATKSYAASREEFVGTPTAPEVDGDFVGWHDLLRTDGRALKLFRRYCQLLDHKAIDELDELIALAPPLKVPDAIHALVDQDDPLETPRELLAWFVDRQAELRGHDDLVEAVGRIAMFPAIRGNERTFASLEALTLPVDRHGLRFADPIGLALVLDDAAGDTVLAFAKQCGIDELSIETYVEKSLLPALDEADEKPPWLERVLVLLADHVHDLDDRPDLVTALAEAELIPCGDGSRRTAAAAYVDTPVVREVLGDTAPIAAVPGAAMPLLQLLEVAETPRPEDIIERLRELSDPRPRAAAVEAVRAIIRHLGRELPVAADAGGRAFARLRLLSHYGPLRELRWLPAKDDRERWYAPAEIYRDNLRYLFASQAKFLDVSTDTRNFAREALEALGVEVNPPTELVVKHLLDCARHEVEPNREVYRHLNDAAGEDELLEPLKSESCLYLTDGQWASPQDVFWDDHHLGRFAHKLGGGAWDEWRPLLTALGVRDRPDHSDAIRVLRALAAEESEALSEDDQGLVQRCWTILEDALETGVVDAHELRGRLGNIACVLDGDAALARPPEIYVDDSPELARRFATRLGNTLVARPRGAWTAMRAAGVRGLRELTHPSVTSAREARPFGVLKRHLQEREAQIARVVEDAAGSAQLKPAVEQLRSLRVFTLSPLEVEWRFTPDPRIRTERETVLAVYSQHDHALYVGGDLADVDLWIDLTCELGAALVPDDGSLGLLKDVLPADPPEAADRLLDRLGIARLMGEIPPPGSDEAVELGGGDTVVDDIEDGAGVEADDGTLSDEPGEDTRVDTEGAGDGSGQAETDEDPDGAGEQPGDGSTGDGSGNTGVPGSGVGRHRNGTSTGTTGMGGSGNNGDGPSTNGHRPPGGGRDRDPSEWWHVIVSGRSRSGDDRSLGRDEQERARRRREIDDAGVAAVCEHEISQGRKPNVMDHYHPGYDIESCNEAGEILRLIEVKSLAGGWGDAGFPRLSPRQWETAQDEQERYWVYVVEHAESEHPPITRLQDPPGAVDGYVLDTGWQTRGEPTPAKAAGADTNLEDDLELLDEEVQALCRALIAQGLAPTHVLEGIGAAGVVVEAAWIDARVALVSAESCVAAVAGWDVARADQTTAAQLATRLAAVKA
jgi:hypothetical protein